MPGWSHHQPRPRSGEATSCPCSPCPHGIARAQQQNHNPHECRTRLYGLRRRIQHASCVQAGLRRANHNPTCNTIVLMGAALASYRLAGHLRASLLWASAAEHPRSSRLRCFSVVKTASTEGVERLSVGLLSHPDCDRQPAMPARTAGCGCAALLCWLSMMEASVGFNMCIGLRCGGRVAILCLIVAVGLHHDSVYKTCKGSAMAQSHGKRQGSRRVSREGRAVCPELDTHGEPLGTCY